MDENQTRLEGDGGYVPHIFQIVEELLNMNYNLTIANERSFGMLLPNGSYSGFVGRLQRGEQDMAVNLLGPTYNRSLAVRYLTALTLVIISMVINTPDADVPASIYVLPFRLPVWGCIMIGFLIILIELAIIMVVSSEKLSSHYEAAFQNARNIYSWVISGEFFVKVLDDASGPSVKVIMATLLIATLITFTYYSSLLTSFLTFQEVKMPFNTFVEMSENNDYRVLMVKYSKYHEQFEMAKKDDPGPFRVWQKIMRDGVERGLISGFTEGYYQLIRSTQQKFVLITDQVSTMYLDRPNCKVSYPPDKCNRDYLNACVRKDFPYGNIVTEALNRMWGNGVMSRLKLLYLRNDPARCRPDRVSQSLGFAQLVTLFVFLSCAWVVALMTVIIEIKVYSRR